MTTRRFARVPSSRRKFRADGAVSLALVLFLGIALFVRIFTDDNSSETSRYSGSLNLSAVIAVLFILAATVLLFRQRHGVSAAVLAAIWLGAWTAIAVGTSGASTETLREGVREVSVLALAIIVYNAGGTVNVPIATRLVQVVGLVPAVLALYQLGSHTGMDVAGHLRAHGTFAHPNSAVMFFGLAATASLWRYLDYGRRRSDAFLVALYAAAVVSTFSIDGLAASVAMMFAFGVLHPGRAQDKVVPCIVGTLMVFAFFATPLGTERIASESTSLVAAERGEANTSFAWRLHKWKTLIPEWEQSPIIGRGLGTTTTAQNTAANPYAGYPPHNEFVRYLVETGIVGSAILLSALIVLLRSLIRKRRVPGIRAAGTFNVATLAIVVILGCLVNSLADNTLLNSPTCYAAALIVAAVLSLPGPGLRTAISEPE
jgi:O-Antigen ligase